MIKVITLLISVFYPDSDNSNNLLYHYPNYFSCYYTYCYLYYLCNYPYRLPFFNYQLTC